jgi:hypothetical protein
MKSRNRLLFWSKKIKKVRLNIIMRLENMPVGTCPTPVSKEPESLKEKAAQIQGKLERVFSLADNIHGELYGHMPTECCEGGNESRLSLEETINQINRTTNLLQDCLHDTLLRLRG